MLCCRQSQEAHGRGAVLSPEDAAWSDGGEDSDAASSSEILIPNCKKPTCIHIDEAAGKPTVADFKRRLLQSWLVLI